MEPKRELSSVDIAAVTRELGVYEGAVLDKAYLYGDDFVRLRMRHHDHGRVELVIEVGPVKRVHVSPPEHVPDAPTRPPDFARMLRNRLEGARLAGVEQHGFDRVVTFEFDRPDGRTVVVAELFGDGNLAVVDANRTVIDCLETIRVTSRTVAPGATYEFPAQRVNPLGLSREAFGEVVGSSDTDLVRTLATQVNLGGLYAEELCTRAGVSKHREVASATSGDLDAVYDAIQEIKAALAAGAFDPRVYRHGDRVVDVAPFALEEYADLESEVYGSMNEAVDAYYYALEQDREAGDESSYEEEIARYERIINQQERAITAFADDAAAEREKAESLYANYGLVDEVLSVVREAREAGHPWDDIEDRLLAGAERGISAAQAVREVDPERGLVRLRIDGRDVDLDPGVGVEKNADRLYQEAKRVEEKREGAMEALEDTRGKLQRLREAGAAAGAQEEAEEGRGDGPAWVARSSVPVRQPEHWYERFRWFHTSDGFLVLGGRDADQNEELVRKYLERGDRFFHAQAHGGPATVLKATGPNERARAVDFPGSTLEEAAQFAVTYSSVWKDGAYAGDVYAVGADQVSKTPESGEYLEKGAFVIRGDRTYYRDTPVGCAVGIQCEPETRVIGGPPKPLRGRAEVTVEVEPGRYAQGDVAKRAYRWFREQFADTAFVRKIASPDEIAKFLPPGGSRILEEP